jgi:hypothetical protein
MASDVMTDRRRPGPTLRRKIAVKFAASMRWLHIYMSMFGLLAMLLFSVTGLTLNHPDWFGAGLEASRSAEGRMDTAWLVGDPGEADDPEADPADSLRKLEIVEHLRAEHKIRGAVGSFTADDREASVSFKGPGYSADAFIDRRSGEYTLSETSLGFVAVLNDLHKGRDTGAAWAWVIDASAVLMALISLTGLVLLFYLKRRRIPGVVVGLVGGAVVVAVAMLLVP